MKKIFSILLCLFVLLQSGILSVQYVFKITSHKRALKAAVAKGVYDHHLLSFSASELAGAEWENDHEFFLGEEKYDVVRENDVNGEIIYSCINDKKEKALINSLAKSGTNSTLVDEILKKINLQFINQFRLTISDFTGIIEKGDVFFMDPYDFIFSRVIIKPPIF